MKKVLKDKQVHHSGLARYIWHQFTFSYRQRCMCVISSTNPLTSDEVINYLTEQFELLHDSPFDDEFICEIWENTNEMFQLTWVATDGSAIDYLVTLFTYLCNL